MHQQGILPNDAVYEADLVNKTDAALFCARQVYNNSDHVLMNLFARHRQNRCQLKARTHNFALPGPHHYERNLNISLKLSFTNMT